MAALIHILCSTFTKIVRQEVCKTMLCWREKNSAKCVFGAILLPLGGGRETFAGSVPRDPAKFRPSQFLFARVITKKVISYVHSVYAFGIMHIRLG